MRLGFGIFGGIIVILIAVFASYFFFDDIEDLEEGSPEKIVQTYLNNVIAREFPKAYNTLDLTTREKCPIEEFVVASVDISESLKGPTINLNSVDVFDDNGKSIINKKGELVCKNPFPSMPTKFWNDVNNLKYKNAYFNKFKGVWHHGDYAEIKKSGGYVIHGRSDATLNPGGVRLGTSEIYSVVEKFKEINESLVVGQSWDNDVRIVLFLIMNNKYDLNDDLIDRIKKQIRQQASPRHVPTKVISIRDIPRTKNGKIAELAVKNAIEGNKIKNIQALANPEILKEFKNLKELKNK